MEPEVESTLCTIDCITLCHFGRLQPRWRRAMATQLPKVCSILVRLSDVSPLSLSDVHLLTISSKRH